VNILQKVLRALYVNHNQYLGSGVMPHAKAIWLLLPPPRLFTTTAYNNVSQLLSVNIMIANRRKRPLNMCEQRQKVHVRPPSMINRLRNRQA